MSERTMSEPASGRDDDPQDLALALRESIARTCELPVEQVRLDSRLEELGIDSLASAEIITDLEISTGLELPMGVLRRLNEVRTVGEVLAQIATPGASAPGRDLD